MNKSSRVLLLLSLLSVISCANDDYLYDKVGFEPDNTRNPNRTYSPPVRAVPDSYYRQPYPQQQPYPPAQQYYPPAASRLYDNPYASPPPNYYPYYESDKYYVPPTYYGNSNQDQGYDPNKVMPDRNFTSQR